MSDDNLTPFFIILLGASVLGVLLGVMVASVTGGATEQKTVVYCVEQPSACKTKYDYYKLENQK